MPASCLPSLAGCLFLRQWRIFWGKCDTLDKLRQRAAQLAQQEEAWAIKVPLAFARRSSPSSVFLTSTLPAGPRHTSHNNQSPGFAAAATECFQDHKRKQSNSTSELSRPLDTRTRTDPVSWSTTFHNTWAIRESHLICQPVTGALWLRVLAVTVTWYGGGYVHSHCHSLRMARLSYRRIANGSFSMPCLRVSRR